jgi:hypothetical protein
MNIGFKSKNPFSILSGDKKIREINSIRLKR